MNGRIGLSNSIKYINLNLKISEDFIFVCENEKIKLDEIYIEITSDSIFKQKQFCFNNLAFLDNNRLFQSTQNLNNETNLYLKIKTNFKNNIRIEENNTFYLDYLYFKHVNIAKEKCEEKILKKSNLTFKPKISVIIPIYNVQNFLIDCLDSIVKQSLKEIEIICVNDGSTDDSLSLLLNYSKIDNRIMIIDQRNRGLSEVRNTGIKFSNGEFIYFLDSDDLLRLNALYELYEYSKKYNLDIIYFQSIEFKNNNKIQIIEKKKDLSNFDNILNPRNIMMGKYLNVRLRKLKKYSTVVWRSFLRKQFYINGKLSFYPGILHEDVLFTLNGILLANRAAYINKKYHYYRINNESIMRTKINVKNLYGCFITYCEILEFLNKRKYEKSVKKAIILSKKFLKKTIRKYMKKISFKEKKILRFKCRRFY